MTWDKDIARMCAVYNSDDSGIGITVPDVPYPRDKDYHPPVEMPEAIRNDPVRSTEYILRVLERIFTDTDNKPADRIKAIALHHEIDVFRMAGMGIIKHQDNGNDRLA